MSLGMDVTTYYAVKKDLSETLTKSDLNSYNDYNTRNTSFIGLPVGPICNMGIKSIEAALKPSDTNYLYFYADIKTGKLYFAENMTEFQKLIETYRQVGIFMKQLIMEMEEYASSKNVPIIEKKSIAFIMKYIKDHNIKNMLSVYVKY